MVLAQLDRGDIAVALRAQLRELYSEWRSVLAELELDGRELQLARDVTGLLERRRDTGLAGSFEVAQARNRVLQVERRQAQSMLRAEEAQTRIAQVCHLPLVQFQRLKLVQREQAVEPLALFDLAALRRQALTQRIEIKRALANYALTESALKLEIARQYPDVVLRPGLRWEPDQFIWSIGAAFVLPLLQRNEAAISAAQARRVASAKEFDAVQQQILAQLETAAGRLAQGRADLRRSVEQVRTSEARLATVSRRFEQGVADRLELTLAQLDALSAQRWPQQARAEYDRRLAALEAAIGAYDGALRQFETHADATRTTEPAAKP